jgi:hypothetical protein
MIVKIDQIFDQQQHRQETKIMKVFAQIVEIFPGDVKQLTILQRLDTVLARLLPVPAAHRYHCVVLDEEPDRSRFLIDKIITMQQAFFDKIKIPVDVSDPQQDILFPDRLGFREPFDGGKTVGGQGENRLEIPQHFFHFFHRDELKINNK